MSSNFNTGMPGANAMGDTLEFVKSLWGSMKIPGMSVPSMAPEDIDKQIADLKAVESWLQLNMNMLRSSIQALEVQSATMSALRSMGESFTKAATMSSPAEASPEFDSPFAQERKNESATASGAMPDPAAMAAQFAHSAAWWDTVQQQFSNAVSQAMSPMTPPAPAKKTPKKAAPKKAAASKTAATKRAGAKKAATKTAATKTAAKKPSDKTEQ
jgi:hypothetical protein